MNTYIRITWIWLLFLFIFEIIISFIFRNTLDIGIIILLWLILLPLINILIQYMKKDISKVSLNFSGSNIIKYSILVIVTIFLLINHNHQPTEGVIFLYCIFSIIFMLDSRISLVFACIVAAFCSITLLTNYTPLTEIFALYTYYFLCIAILTQTIEVIVSKFNTWNWEDNKKRKRSWLARKYEQIATHIQNNFKKIHTLHHKYFYYFIGIYVAYLCINIFFWQGTFYTFANLISFIILQILLILFFKEFYFQELSKYFTYSNYIAWMIICVWFVWFTLFGWHISNILWLFIILEVGYIFNAFYLDKKDMFLEREVSNKKIVLFLILINIVISTCMIYFLQEKWLLTNTLTYSIISLLILGLNFTFLYLYTTYLESMKIRYQKKISCIYNKRINN